MKVEIKIGKGKYVESVKNGAEYVSVDYSGKHYGGGSPCDSEKEVIWAIERSEETIKKEGDTPIINWGNIKPLATKENLMRWVQ